MPPDDKLSAVTSGFALAAGITALVNTALSCAKDACAPFKDFVKSLTDQDWTTQGLVDLALFVALGLIFTTTRVGDRIHPSRLVAGLVGAVVIAGLGLAL